MKPRLAGPRVANGDYLTRHLRAVGKHAPPKWAPDGSLVAAVLP